MESNWFIAHNPDNSLALAFRLRDLQTVQQIEGQGYLFIFTNRERIHAKDLNAEQAESLLAAWRHGG